MTQTVALAPVLAEHIAAVNAFDEDAIVATFADDQPGQVTGQGVQGFFVATPGLTAITGSPAPAAPSGHPNGY